jgi:hypothetical protein
MLYPCVSKQHVPSKCKTYKAFKKQPNQASNLHIVAAEKKQLTVSI